MVSDLCVPLHRGGSFVEKAFNHQLFERHKWTVKNWSSRIYVVDFPKKSIGKNLLLDIAGARECANGHIHKLPMTVNMPVSRMIFTTIICLMIRKGSDKVTTPLYYTRSCRT